MNIPLWIKPAAYGAVAGGIAVAIVGFSWAGWVTGGSAQASALAAADASRTDLAAAVCVQNFMADENARENLEGLKALTSNIQKRSYIEAGDWAVMPGNDEAARPTAVLCSRMLAELEPTELPVVDNGEVREEGDVIETEAVEAGEEEATSESSSQPSVSEPAAPDAEVLDDASEEETSSP